jgi:hypothetical protein
MVGPASCEMVLCAGSSTAGSRSSRGRAIRGGRSSTCTRPAGCPRSSSWIITSPSLGSTSFASIGPMSTRPLCVGWSGRWSVASLVSSDASSTVRAVDRAVDRRSARRLARRLDRGSASSWTPRCPFDPSRSRCTSSATSRTFRLAPSTTASASCRRVWSRSRCPPSLRDWS